MARFLEELKRRRVFQVVAAYAVVAWLVVQIVATVQAPLGLPGRSVTLVIVLVVLGFPLAVVLGWAYDLTSKGIVRTPDAPDTLARRGDTSPAAAGNPKRAILPNSVAVLPLENLSPNPDDAYFAAGIHEEILNYLSKIEDLNVIARTSVRRYAGTNKPISEIAEELGVKTVMEGSVRYAGDRVRVAAQLIDASSDRHLWSEIYERSLADVFAIQADIASRVANALEARLSAGERRRFEAMPTTVSSEAHALYLKSQALFGQGDTALAVTAPHGLRARIQSQLEQAIANDPDFAQPYALLALLYAASRMYDPVSTSEWTRFIGELDRRVRSNASRAISLNRELGLPYFALALNDQFGWRWASARDNYRRATELQPNDALLITWTATLEWLSGNLGAAVERARRAVNLDPGNAWPTHILGLILHVAGEHEESVAVYETISATHPESPLAYLHRTLPEIALGHEAKALEGLKLADRLIPAQAAPAIRIHLAYLYGRLGKHAEAARIITGVRSSLGDRFVDPIMWVLASLATGEQAQALESLNAALASPEQRQEVFGRAYVKDNVWGDPVLERPEFVVRRRRLREIDDSDQGR